VVALVVAVGVWQHHFVLQAASADIYIFGLLVTAGAFGVYQAIHGTHRLNDEFIALEAMKEVYEDALWAEREPHDLMVAQFKRTTQDAIVYRQPSALATAHNLIVQEVQRNGSFRIPTATMQVLVADVETKLDDRQGMSHYLGALMVLLGLLGTFIGLMHTLESVGGILGSMDLSGAGGSGAIAALIESLKRPLEGMSVGFGASLFGLIGSLIIGFLSKVDAKASNRLKHAFETWVCTTVQIENMRAATAEARLAGAARADPADGQSLAAAARPILKTARLALTTVDRLAHQVEALTEAVAADRHERERFLQAGEDLRDAANRMLTLQALLDSRLLENAQGLADLHRGICAVGDRLAAAMLGQSQTISGGAQSLRDEARLLRESLNAGLARLAAPAPTAPAPVDAIEQAVSRGFAQAAPNTDHVAALTAELDQLIAMSHFSPSELSGLKRLAALAREEADPFSPYNVGHEQRKTG
jgi:biopolymer transport protein ExbB/TolQ